ncbi:RusA family crossover junction endodeoxyribonuclease [Humibacter sp.]|uniref:RusA family crossover junction endodeoxyribonuclease n=1 Tax=Humibacter sp. TaxID=1940291 RepID=UPI003F7D9235
MTNLFAEQPSTAHPEQVIDGAARDEVSFFVTGTPVPQGSKTAFVVGKRAVVTDQNRVKLKPWRETVAIAADMGRTFPGPVEVVLVFSLPKPQRPRWFVPAVKPDIDKLVRAVFDGLTDGGLIDDDARIITLTASKVYALPLGVHITVREAQR